MIGIAVLSILVTLAIPSFRTMMERNAVSAAVTDLLSSVLLTRSEAIKREQQIVIAKKGADWKDWQVFLDADNDGSFDLGTEELFLEYSSDYDFTVAQVGNMGDFVSFSSRGRAILQVGDGFKFTKGSHQRYLCFSVNGRPHIQEGACS